MEIVLGPPGTGKTTYLLEQMEQELDRGVPPDRIGFVSFTRRAAQEAKERAMAKFKLESKSLPYVRTLHSLCFRALGISNSEVLEGKKLQEFGAYCKIVVSGFASMEEGATFGFLEGDRAMFMDNLARVKGITLREQFQINRDDLLWSKVEWISDKLAAFKKAHHLMDYTDMLAQFIKSEWSARLEVLLVDEAQDLSWLQWQVVAHLAKGTRRQIVAGDDDQAIYRWAGAAVEHFIDLPGDVKVLDHSWRVPPEIQPVALDVLRRVRKRREKVWNPRDGKGYVNRVTMLETSGLEVNEDTLILSRNSCFLRDDAMKYLKSEGVLYEYHGQPSVRQSLVDAIVDWERLRRGEEVPVGRVENVYAQMNARVGYEWGQKKLPAYEDREQPVTLQDLREAGGLKVDTPWFEALTNIKGDERLYMQAVLRGGQKLTEKPKIRISTIHGAKGAQADHVILLTDMAWRTHTEMKENPEDEARTWYVATTRAKQRLSIVKWQANQNRVYDINIPLQPAS